MQDLGNYEDLEFSETQLEFVRSAKRDYTNQIAGADRNDATLSLLKVVDSINEEELAKNPGRPSCDKGCSHCCFIQVGASPREIDLIVSHMEKKNIGLNNESMIRLHEQSLIKDEKEYMMSMYRRCVFLNDENRCSIYEVRPFACRNYFVYSEPEKCNTFTAEIGTKTLVHFSMNPLPILLTLVGEEGSSTLPKLLFKKLTNVT